MPPTVRAREGNLLMAGESRDQATYSATVQEAVHYRSPDWEEVAIGVFYGSLVMFVWGFLSWLVLGLHNNSLKALPAEDAYLSAFAAQKDLESGVYIAPSPPRESKKTPAGQELWKAYSLRFEQGPLLFLSYHKTGLSAAGGGRMFGGYLLNLLAAAIAGLMLYSCTLPGYSQRVALVSLMGLFAALTCHFASWNWMFHPWSYTVAMSFDLVFGWTLAGLVMARKIRPRVVSGRLAPEDR